MSPSSVHLPDGQTYTVQPVFGGLFFKNNEMNVNPTPFPAGWTVALHTEEQIEPDTQHLSTPGDGNTAQQPRRNQSHRYRQPTLQNDTIFISSISTPSSSDFRPHASPSRQIALMLWISLYWYFQQPEPSPFLCSEQTKDAPLEAKPKGDWRIRIRCDGVFRSKNMIPKLERMGLITSLDTSVGSGLDEKEQGWDQMFVTRSMFWQIHSGIFLFTLQPLRLQHPSPGSYPASPVTSRPASPVTNDMLHKTLSPPPGTLPSIINSDLPGGPVPTSLGATPSFPVGPYYSSSHLPTYYPPPPLQYTITNNIRHPRRQKPYRMGEIFYSRFIPSTGKYLSFRVASLSPKPVPHLGPVGKAEGHDGHAYLTAMSDCDLLRSWLSKPRVSAFWGGYYDSFLPDALKSQHSFPAIGLWDGVPFGYFEIYWVKEDRLGQHMGSEAHDFDRGLHVLIGEEWARGKVAVWLSSLVQWCWQADNRTMDIYLEPRIDNERFVQLLEKSGFAKEKQIALPHKQAWLCRLRRETWNGPAW
ncbi:acyl-CoA N-acyltransferase [Xylariaceae sp. FL0594]|nr:acyl-CoA N-acyltransferase [Xylariaceae sp. FL0594]